MFFLSCGRLAGAPIIVDGHVYKSLITWFCFTFLCIFVWIFTNNAKSIGDCQPQPSSVYLAHNICSIDVDGPLSDCFPSLDAHGL